MAEPVAAASPTSPLTGAANVLWGAVSVGLVLVVVGFAVVGGSLSGNGPHTDAGLVLGSGLVMAGGLGLGLGVVAYGTVLGLRLASERQDR
ncbi:MAG: hypothetical protein ACXVW1_12390 [Nocardioides sp.]